MCVWSDDLWTPEEENQGEPEWLTQERAHFSQHRDKNGDGKLDKVSRREGDGVWCGVRVMGCGVA